MAIGAPKQVKVSDPDANDRTVKFDLRLESDPLAIAIAEAGGQPEISTNGGSWTATGIGTLTYVGEGKYDAVLTQSAISVVGSWIQTRYKSANTVETPGTQVFVTVEDPGDDHVAIQTASLIDALAGTPGIIVLPTTSQQLTLGEAVTLANSALRNTVQDSNKTDDIKQAIRVLVADFINMAKMNVTVATFTATIDDPELDLSSVAGFRSERFVRAQIGFSPPLKLVDYDSLSRDLDGTSESGTPELIAFDTATTAYVSPRPETAASIKIKYSMSANELVNDTDTIQIPAEYLRPAIWWGVPALLRNAGQEGDEGDRGWRRYREIVKRFVGAGVANKGNLVVDRSKYN